MKEKIFINLTNGIESLPEFDISDVNFIRIQSSHCERKKYDLIINDIDNNFLMYAALGFECKVYDFAANSEVSKAVYSGLEWLRYVLNKRWLGLDYRPVIKGKKVDTFFAGHYSKLDYKQKRKIDYFNKYLLTDNIKITGICSQTSNDNKSEFYRKVLEEIYNKIE